MSEAVSAPKKRAPRKKAEVESVEVKAVAPAQTTVPAVIAAPEKAADEPKTVAAKAPAARKAPTAVKKAAGSSPAKAAEAAKPEADAKPARKPAVRKAAQTAPVVQIPEEERQRLIEVAAYYIAERRGFVGGSHEADWLEAEQQVNAMIAEGKIKPV